MPATADRNSSSDSNVQQHTQQRHALQQQQQQQRQATLQNISSSPGGDGDGDGGNTTTTDSTGQLQRRCLSSLYAHGTLQCTPSELWRWSMRNKWRRPERHRTALQHTNY